MTPQHNPILLISPETLRITEGDCACSSTHTVPKNNPTKLGRLHVPTGMMQLSLNDNFEVFLPPFGQNGASVLNKEAVSALNSFDRRFRHSQTMDINSDALLAGFLSQGLLISDDLEKLPLSKSNTLTAWLHITDRCNLRCSYCYLPHVREDMSLETAQLAIHSMIRSAQKHGYDHIKLKYAGGEPLIRFPFILEVHEYAQRQIEENGLTLDAVLLTNGTLLTDEISRNIASRNIHLMISLDGVGDYHDAQRSHSGGKGSFADVSAGIERAMANGLLPNISITVSAKTIDGLPDLLAWIMEKELPFNLNFYRENELSMQDVDLQFTEEKMIAGLLKAFKVIEANLPLHNALGQIVDRSNLSGSHIRTCDVGENYLVYDQNGQIAKCQMLIRNPVASMYDYDPLDVIRKDDTVLQNLPVIEKEGCKTCEWKHWCAGGCSLATYRATGRYNVKSPNCNIYKAVFPELLRLEGLRILKYAKNYCSQ